MTLNDGDFLYPIMTPDNKVVVVFMKPATLQDQFGVPYMTADNKVTAGEVVPITVEDEQGWATMTADGKVVPVKGTTYDMVINVVEDSEAYIDFPAAWTLDVDRWNDKTDEVGEALGFKMIMPGSNLGRAAAIPPAVPDDHATQVVNGPGSISLDDWKNLIYQPLVDEFGKPSTVSICFAQTIPSETDITEYDPELQQFEDFLFDDEGVGECILTYLSGRWLAFDKIWRDFALEDVLLETTTFGGGIFDNRCRGMPDSWT